MNAAVVTARATPVPARLYVHDDVTGPGAAFTAPPEAAPLIARLLGLVARERRVTVLSLAEQVEGLVAGGPPPPIALAVGIGGAGERVARQVHARAGWFPAVRRIELAREEDGDGYRLVTPGAGPLEQQLDGLPASGAIAVVDDTVFSGLTMEAVLRALPPPALARAHAFCLRGVAGSLTRIAALCPVRAGFAAGGRLLEDVSFINASGLFRRGAIRRAGRPPLAFHERPEWIRAWFPADAREVVAICRELAALVDDPVGGDARAAAVDGG